MANRNKNWTEEEMSVLKAAVKLNPTNPHKEFGSVAQILGKSKAAVLAKYARMYGENRVRAYTCQKIQRTRFRGKPIPVLSEKEVLETKDTNKKKKLNAFQRFVKRLFNI